MISSVFEFLHSKLDLDVLGGILFGTGGHNQHPLDRRDGGGRERTKKKNGKVGG